MDNIDDLLFCDTETFNETPIADGTYIYAANAEVMLFPYAFGDEPVQLWDRTLDPKMPSDLQEALHDDSITTVWQNSMFDRNVLKCDLDIHLDTSRIIDTMVIALMHSLPGALGSLCDIFGLSEDLKKQKAGRKLIQLFCKPQAYNRKVSRETRLTHPEEWERFKDYARGDILAMREIYKKLPKWNMTPVELSLWQLDQRINDRGFEVDIELAENAIEAVTRTKKLLAKRTAEVTDGEVGAATQRDKLLAFILREYGVTLPDLQKSTVERRIQDLTLPAGLRELLQIRLEASTTSVSKYNKLVKGVNTDNRLRGTLQFCGAQRTARWAGRTFQPQNLPRPKHSYEKIIAELPAMKSGCMDLISDDTIGLASSMLRSAIIAPEGHKLVVSDLSNIEGRVAAWLGGQTWKTEAFEAFDRGDGPDLYKLTYAKAFKIPVEDVTKEQRAIGKVQELALAYGGGVGAFVSMVLNYGIDLTEMSESVYGDIPAEIKQQAASWYTICVRGGKTLDLSEKVFITCDSLKRMWRETNSGIVGLWSDLEEIFESATQCGNINRYRDLEFSAATGKIVASSEKAWVKIRLPSGRYLSYPAPSKSESGDLQYMGINTYTKKWEKLNTYGGKLFENICQAVARDVMTSNMPLIEDSGYKIVLTVHDEILAEVPTGMVARCPATGKHTSTKIDDIHMSKLLATVPKWAKGLPLAAAGFEGPRYRKD